ncbi:MAG: sulfite exporter TauE/SafE family protein, partial [Candidatus Acidiferrales bacterium]
AIYIGYFGAGAGILTLGMLALLGIEDIHAMNGTKTLLVSVVNAVALILFVSAKVIVWPEAIVMLAGAAAGGYGGAYWAQKVNPRAIRAIVIVVGFGMAAYFFATQFA